MRNTDQLRNPTPGQRAISAAGSGSGIAQQLINSFMKSQFSPLSLLVAFALAAVCLIQFKQNGDLKRKLAALQAAIEEKRQQAEVREAKVKQFERQQSGYRSEVQSLM